MADVNGKNFRALRRLSDRDNNTLAAFGQTCERVPVKSLAALLASGKIEPVKPVVVVSAALLGDAVVAPEPKGKN